MDSSAERLQSPRSQAPRQRGSAIPGGRSLAWLAGLFVSFIAVVVATVMAVALAASVVVIAVMGGALLLLAPLALRARRAVKAKADPGPQILEARNVGGHSWVAYGWDQRR